MWSKYTGANFHMNFFVCVSAAKSVAPPLLIPPEKGFNGDSTKGCYIEGDNIITAPKVSIKYTLF